MRTYGNDGRIIVSVFLLDEYLCKREDTARRCDSNGNGWHVWVA